MEVKIREIYENNNIRPFFIKDLFEFIKCSIESAKLENNL